MPSSKIQIVMPERLSNRLRSYCSRSGLDMSEVARAAIGDYLHAREETTMRANPLNSSPIDTLQDLTGKESGAVQYDDGSIWIGNWTQCRGIPRTMVYGATELPIGLGEDLSDAEECDVPEEAIAAMTEHEGDQGEGHTPDTKYRAWHVRDAVVVIADTWN